MLAGTPAWSTNGMQIVFAGAPSSTSSYQLWSMNADGSGQQQITHLSGSSASQPAFSPSGAEIAFTDIVTDTAGATTSRIYTMNADGSAPAPLTAGPGDGYSSWPNDMQILFARATPDGKISLVFRKKLSGEESQLSPAGAFYTEPQPSADGPWPPAMSERRRRIAASAPLRSERLGQWATRTGPPPATTRTARRR